jgi:hypothetical protein
MWKEISRQCETDSEISLDLNPCEIAIFVAEIVGEQDGTTLYCTTCWAPFMADIHAFEVTTEPVSPYLFDLELEDHGALERIRSQAILRREIENEEYDGPFSEQFYAMVEMINKKAVEVGYRSETYDHSDDLDDL